MSQTEVETLEISARGTPIRFAVPNGRLRVWATRFEEIEPELLNVIDDLAPGTVFYDIGASIGLFSLYAALHRGLRPVCFEPEAQNYATLELNHYLNRSRLPAPLIAFNVAVADSPGMGRIHTRVYGAGEHGKILDQAVTQDTKQGFEAAHVQTVLRMPLDQMVAICALPAPGMIKLDVDGAEAAVLRGAQATLRSRELHTVFVELSDQSNSDERAMLEQHGFRQVAKHPVVRLRGGYYPDLWNCVFRR